MDSGALKGPGNYKAWRANSDAIERLWGRMDANMDERFPEHAKKEKRT